MQMEKYRFRQEEIGEGWKNAEDIHVGDIVCCRTGEPEKINNVWMEKLPVNVKIYWLFQRSKFYTITSEKTLILFKVFNIKLLSFEHLVTVCPFKILQ